MSTPEKRMSFRDHLNRSSSLLDYARIQVEQSAYLLTILMIYYPTLCVEWSCWATQLRSVSHQMEALSLSLAMMGREKSPLTGVRLLTSREASMIYSQYLEERNESIPDSLD